MCCMENGSLDRAKLRQIVFADPAQRHWLQRLLHPLISTHLQQQIASRRFRLRIAGQSVAAGIRPEHGWCDRVLVIDAPEDRCS